MAHREHVTARVRKLLALTAFSTVLVTGCSQADPPATEFRGRVIDQDTGQGISGAIVVGKYMGSRGPEGSSACNRVESAVSDSEGWFTMPIDPRDGGPLMEAYHRGYRWGRSPRNALRGIDGNMHHWQVQIVEWNADIDHAKLVRYEPTIYTSQSDAMAASRQELDVYLKPFVAAREERLRELHRLTNAGSCNAPHRTTQGPVPFFDAIYVEQIELVDSPRFLEMLQQSIQSADSLYAGEKAKR